MAILGVLIDKASNTRAADALAGVTLTTLAHSLPATNAEARIPVVRSVQAGSGFGVAVCQLLALGGNASLNTIGFASTESTASCPTIYYDIISMVFHTAVR